MRISAFSCIKKRPNCALTPRGLQIDCRTSRGPCRNIVGLFLKLLGLVLGASGGAIGLPEGPTDYASQGHCDSHSAADEAAPPRGVWGEGAAEDVPHEEFFDVLRLHAGPLQRRFAELDCRDIGESAAKSAERPDNAAGKVDFSFCRRIHYERSIRIKPGVFRQIGKAFRDLMVRRDDLEYFRHRHFRPTPKPPKQNPNAK